MVIDTPPPPVPSWDASLDVCPIDRLHDDTLGAVLGFCSRLQLLECAAVSRRWHQLAASPPLWAHALAAPRAVYFRDLPYRVPPHELEEVYARARQAMDLDTLKGIAAPAATRQAVLKWYYVRSLRELNVLAQRRGGFGAGVGDARGGVGVGVVAGGLGGESGAHQTATLTTRAMLALLCVVCVGMFAAGLILRTDFPTADPAHIPSLPMVCIPLVFGAFAWFLGTHYWLHAMLPQSAAVLYGTAERLTASGRWRAVLDWNWVLSTLQLGPFVSSFWLLVQWRHDYDYTRSGAHHSAAAAAAGAVRWSYVSIAGPVLASLLGHALLFAGIAPAAPWHTRFLRDCYELLARNAFLVTEPFADGMATTRCVVWSASAAMTACFVWLLAVAADATPPAAAGKHDPLASATGGAAAAGAATYGWIGVFAPLLWLQLVYWYAFVCRCASRRGTGDDDDDDDGIDAAADPALLSPAVAAPAAGLSALRSRSPRDALQQTLREAQRNAPERRRHRPRTCVDRAMAALVLGNGLIWLVLLVVHLKYRYFGLWLHVLLLGLAVSIPSIVVYAGVSHST